MLNSIIDNTPIEQLSQVSLTPTDSLPPDSGFDTFGEMNRRASAGN